MLADHGFGADETPSSTGHVERP